MHLTTNPPAMQYHVAQNGEKTGPFDRDEIYRRLVAGELQPTDLGWQDGMAEWEPLSKLFPPQTPPAAVPVFGPATTQAGQSFASPPKTSGLAITSLVCGILSFFTCGLTGIPAIITGHMSRSRIKQSMGAIGGSGIATAGLITGYLGFVFIFVAVLASLAVPVFTKVSAQGNQMKAMSNAKQIVLGMKQYAADNDGKYPPTLEPLFEEEILTDRRLLEFPPAMSVPGQGWEYLGADHTDSDPGNIIVLTSRKADHTGKKIVARNDGSVQVVRESELP